MFPQSTSLETNRRNQVRYTKKDDVAIFGIPGTRMRERKGEGRKANERSPRGGCAQLNIPRIPKKNAHATVGIMHTYVALLDP